MKNSFRRRNSELIIVIADFSLPAISIALKENEKVVVENRFIYTNLTQEKYRKSKGF